MNPEEKYNSRDICGYLCRIIYPFFIDQMVLRVAFIELILLKFLTVEYLNSDHGRWAVWRAP